jgi:riboflavin synthase
VFTGLIQATGAIRAIEPCGLDRRFLLDSGKLDLSDVRTGDSIAVSGVCLTVTAKQAKGFWVDVSAETLSCSTFADMYAGDEVNLEKSLTLPTPLGGHLVSGHVDGIGTLRERRDEGRSVRLTFSVPESLAKYIAAKGSISIDGVSLTVNDVDGPEFEVNIIPHTWEETVIKHYRVGVRVNLEVDLVARYLERLLLGERAAEKGASGISMEFLAKNGFTRDR